MGYGSRCQVQQVCIKNCNTAGFFTLYCFPCVSIMIHHPNNIQPVVGNGSLMKEDKGG